MIDWWMNENLTMVSIGIVWLPYHTYIFSVQYPVIPLTVGYNLYDIVRRLAVSSGLLAT